MTYSGFKGFIFDMDGTLLNTLPDMVLITNEVLELEGFPPHTDEEILTFVGDGVKSLILQAIPDGASDEQVNRIVANFRSHYSDHGVNLSKQFDGMEDVLAQLKQQGKKLGIMSNKFEAGVFTVRDRYFPGLFDATHGESDVIPRKPDPTGILACVEEMGLTPNECIYFGDSHGDMLAAHNAGVTACAVKWGYQPLAMLESAQPDAWAETPQDILKFA